MNKKLSHALHDIYRLLHEHYGPTDWWPGDTPFEIAVGAVLTQNTSWSNVERAIANLKRAKLLGPRKILACRDGVLEDALQPSGYFRVKTRRVRSFCRYLVSRYRGNMARMAARPLDELRPELLSVDGIGPETADDILLYACEKPVFVVDAYTRRILSRHSLCPPDIAYEALRALFEDHLEADLQLFKEYHGLLVFTGKDFCRRTPKCDQCPLGPLLKPAQPLLDR
ncbi:MAG: endonuclease III domain-containing protein [Candidatus Hydrogenedentota bacterium]